jgi:osmotically inducible protein OsmC
MKLSFNLTAAGFEPEELHVEGTITLADGAITQSKLVLTAKVKDISKEKFDELVKDAEKNCPVSKLLNTEIVVESTLN